VWADSLLDAERRHLLELLLWSALSVFSATTIAVTLVAKRIRSALLSHFAIQMLAWGLVIAAIAAFEIHTLDRRDVAGAARLERLLWVNIGLDTGYVLVGVTLVAAGRRLARSMAAMGAGAGIIIQGLALLLIDLQFAAIISR
jgi:hypothetical protein